MMRELIITLCGHTHLFADLSALINQMAVHVCTVLVIMLVIRIFFSNTLLCCL